MGDDCGGGCISGYRWFGVPCGGRDWVDLAGYIGIGEG